MKDGKKILAIIPARGGSKGVKRKNIRLVANKPLIAWTIMSARQSKYIDSVIVSSEDDEIMRIASEWGSNVILRPAHLAQDDTPGIDPVFHVIENCPGYDYVVLLQPTSPLRTSADIDGCIDFVLTNQSPCSVSVCKSSKSPYWMYFMDNNHCLKPVINGELYTRRQLQPDVYALNGAIYFAEIQWLQSHKSFMSPETCGYEMPPERSFDVDTELDLEICNYFLEKQQSNLPSG